MLRVWPSSMSALEARRSVELSDVVKEIGEQSVDMERVCEGKLSFVMKETASGFV